MTARKTKHRNIDLEWTPEVIVAGREIVVTTGVYRGNTRYKCKGELSMWCAARLVKELRKAMRQIRREQLASLNDAISDAEQVLE